MYFVVLPFVREDDTGELVAAAGPEAPPEQSAMSRARAMVRRKGGAIAFSPTGDPAFGGFEDTVIPGRYGETPMISSASRAWRDLTPTCPTAGGAVRGSILMRKGLAKPYVYRWLGPPRGSPNGVRQIAQSAVAAAHSRDVSRYRRVRFQLP